VRVYVRVRVYARVRVHVYARVRVRVSGPAVGCLGEGQRWVSSLPAPHDPRCPVSASWPLPPFTRSGIHDKINVFRFERDTLERAGIQDQVGREG
jgi:hypothetical protein